jgi:hypothetical protein
VRTRAHTLSFVPVPLLVFAFVSIWVAATLIIGAWIGRERRPDLVDRLQMYQPSVADDAEEWLHQRH